MTKIRITLVAEYEFDAISEVSVSEDGQDFVVNGRRFTPELEFHQPAPDGLSSHLWVRVSDDVFAALIERESLKVEITELTCG